MSAIPRSSSIQSSNEPKPFRGRTHRLRTFMLGVCLSLHFACNDGNTIQSIKNRDRVGINHAEDATKPISLAQENKYSLTALSNARSKKDKSQRSDLEANGEELYTVLCSSCHGGAINMVGKNLSDLQKATQEVPEMASLEGVVCSDPDLSEALFNYINGNASN